MNYYLNRILFSITNIITRYLFVVTLLNCDLIYDLLLLLFFACVILFILNFFDFFRRFHWIIRILCHLINSIFCLFFQIFLKFNICKTACSHLHWLFLSFSKVFLFFDVTSSLCLFHRNFMEANTMKPNYIVPSSQSLDSFTWKYTNIPLTINLLSSVDKS